MENLVLKDVESYIDGFARFERSVAGNGWLWLSPLRKEAISKFKELGFPTTRHEEWKFTNVAPITKTSFRLTERATALPAGEELEKFTIPELDVFRLVFIDGHFTPELSSIRELPEGVKIKSLRDALSQERELLEPHLSRYVDLSDDAFSSLNTAFMQDGVFVYVPENTVLPEPVHVLYVSTGPTSPTITHPRNLIVAGKSSEATVIEDYVSLGEGVNFSNVVTELVAGENSHINHYKIERENRKAFNVSTLRIEQLRNSSVSTHAVLIGGALVRNNIHPVLDGEGGSCLINGLFMATGSQHMDNHMLVEHVSPHCDSRQFYYGILDGRSKGVFSGRIVVHKDAQKTDAKQTNRNLLLSEEASIDTKPQLVIHADDVKCTHGATIGQMDESALFYMRSRAIPLDKAKAILLLAFAGESLKRIDLEPLRVYLEGVVAEWFSSEHLNLG
ncbi:MAG: Fe-S cluster assembly protein SufD [Thermodesulfobacteriota bacterium]